MKQSQLHNEAVEEMRQLRIGRSIVILECDLDVLESLSRAAGDTDKADIYKYMRGNVESLLKEARVKRGDIVVCSHGYVGVLSQGEPKEVTYPDGNKGVAYVGYHLSSPVGRPWSSRKPKVIGHADGLAEFIETKAMQA